MKRLVFVLLAILIAFGAFMTWQQLNGSSAVVSAADTQPGTSPDALVSDPAAAGSDPAAATEPPPAGLDYDAIRALYGENETVMRLADEELSWGEFSDWLCTTGKQVEDYFNQMYLYYGVAADWSGSVGDDSGRSYAQYTVGETSRYLTRVLSIRAKAAELGLALDEEDLASREDRRRYLRRGRYGGGSGRRAGAGEPHVRGRLPQHGRRQHPV